MNPGTVNRGHRGVDPERRRSDSGVLEQRGFEWIQCQHPKSGRGERAERRGAPWGTGSVGLSPANGQVIPVAIKGSGQDTVQRQRKLSFYGPAESSLGVSGDWQNYTATVTGNVSITLTVPTGLTLNGQALPAGTYTITTNSATLSGSGTMSSPNFAGLGLDHGDERHDQPRAGERQPLRRRQAARSDDETTLDGYTGTINVSANGDGTDSVALNGNAGNVLQVAVHSRRRLDDRPEHAGHVPANVQTSLADTYNLTANAPPGWTVTIDNSGNVTATPAPGLQSGTYPIQIIAQSQTDPNLVAQTTVDVTITPTQPGMNFTVASDPIFTVPFNGAQLPTAFRATIQNLGPAADTYNLTFSNIPSGFTLLNSGTSVTVPAGQTGILGLYLQPNPGQPIPAPGTQALVHRHGDQHDRPDDHPDADRDVHGSRDRCRDRHEQPDRP